MSYLIDGYNLLFWLNPKVNPLHHGRSKIIEELSQLIDTLEFKAIIVFDSDSESAYDFPSRAFLGNLEVIFSPRGQSADDYIIEFLTVSKKRNEYTLISCDRELTETAKRLGVKSQSIEAFMQKIAKKQRPREVKPEMKDPHIEQLCEIFEKRFLKMWGPHKKKP